MVDASWSTCKQVMQAAAVVAGTSKTSGASEMLPEEINPSFPRGILHPKKCQDYVYMVYVIINIYIMIYHVYNIKIYTIYIDIHTYMLLTREMLYISALKKIKLIVIMIS